MDNQEKRMSEDERISASNQNQTGTQTELGRIEKDVAKSDSSLAENRSSISEFIKSLKKEWWANPIDKTIKVLSLVAMISGGIVFLANYFYAHAGTVVPIAKGFIPIVIGLLLQKEKLWKSRVGIAINSILIFVSWFLLIYYIQHNSWANIFTYSVTLGLAFATIIMNIYFYMWDRIKELLKNDRELIDIDTAQAESVGQITHSVGRLIGIVEVIIRDQKDISELLLDHQKTLAVENDHNVPTNNQIDESESN